MLERLAVRLGRKDDQPNIDLAKEIAAEGGKGLDEIVQGVTGADSSVAGDCIKVLYETGARKPELIAGYADVFVKLLKSRNNRLIWGAMTALSEIVLLCPDEIFHNIDIIKNAYENGSVITVDCSITVFAGLCRSRSEYEKEIFPMILNHLKSCRPKEVAQHAERAFPAVNSGNSAQFINILEERYDTLTEPQKKRIDKLLKKIHAGDYLRI